MEMSNLSNEKLYDNNE